jgi:hypothetical protein
MAAQRIDAHCSLLDEQLARLCSISVSCCSSLLIGTKRIPARDIAPTSSDGASASPKTRPPRGGESWTPIRGHFWKPIDSEPAMKPRSRPVVSATVAIENRERGIRLK